MSRFLRRGFQPPSQPLFLKELDMIARYLVMVSAILMLAGGSSAGDKKNDDQKQLQGQWRVVSSEISGKKIKGGEGFLVIKGNKWRAPVGATFTFKLDPTKKPKELDLLSSKGGIWRGIYKIEGDSLTFCRSHGSAGERPKNFKGGEGVVLFVYKRAEK
jgi:uncharacterized protein (TIGR03067 family)